MLRGLLLDKAHLQTAACLTLACICLGTLSLGGTALPHGSLIPLVLLFDDATILRQVFLSAQILYGFPFVSVCIHLHLKFVCSSTWIETIIFWNGLYWSWVYMRPDRLGLAGQPPHMDTIYMNQPAVFLFHINEPATIRTSHPNRLMDFHPLSLFACRTYSSSVSK